MFTKINATRVTLVGSTVELKAADTQIFPNDYETNGDDDAVDVEEEESRILG